jgi:hypothetical protein
VLGHYSQSNESLFSAVSSQQLAIIAAVICTVFVFISKIKESKIRFANKVLILTKRLFENILINIEIYILLLKTYLKQ